LYPCNHDLKLEPNTDGVRNFDPYMWKARAAGNDYRSGSTITFMHMTRSFLVVTSLSAVFPYC